MCSGKVDLMQSKCARQSRGVTRLWNVRRIYDEMYEVLVWKCEYEAGKQVVGPINKKIIINKHRHTNNTPSHTLTHT